MILCDYIQRKSVRVVIVVNQIIMQFRLAQQIKDILNQKGIMVKSESSNSVTLLSNESHVLVTSEERVVTGALRGYWFDVLLYVDNLENKSDVLYMMRPMLRNDKLIGRLEI